jgi:hypothetical protein
MSDQAQPGFTDDQPVTVSLTKNIYNKKLPT